MNQVINDEAVFITATATPGLLNNSAKVRYSDLSKKLCHLTFFCNFQILKVFKIE